jgi:rhodanese-related sulfurtransferase/CBS domain-containing protein
MVVRVDALQAAEMMRRGTQVADALPAWIYAQEHLPGAVSLPLETFTPERARETIDPDRDVIVYCFDQHCDLSSRTTARLESIGFDKVHDLIGGRAAWTVAGFPTEGQVGDRRRVSHFVVEGQTVPLDATIADAVAAADGNHRDPIAVLGSGRVVLGALQPTALELPPQTRVESAMIPAPSTIRPDIRIEHAVEQLGKDGLDHVFVTTISGQLVGLLDLERVHA